MHNYTVSSSHISQYTFFTTETCYSVAMKFFTPGYTEYRQRTKERKKKKLRYTKYKLYRTESIRTEGEKKSPSQ